MAASPAESQQQLPAAPIHRSTLTYLSSGHGEADEDIVCQAVAAPLFFLIPGSRDVQP